MESYSNVESEALDVRVRGIVCPATQQSRSLIIASDTVNSTHPLQTAPAFQCTRHIESRDTIHLSSINLLGHFAMIAMPPKGGKRTASVLPGPTVNNNKHDGGSHPNHYMVDNWKGFLPKK
jgi:hypothetical protein